MLWWWEEPVAAVVNHFQGCEGKDGDGEMESILPAAGNQHWKFNMRSKSNLQEYGQDNCLGR